MSDLARWQPTYYMAANKSITTETDFSSTGSTYGTYGTGKPIVYLTNNPPFEPNREIISTRKSTGNAFLTKAGSTAIERSVGIEAPSTTFEMDFDVAAAFIPFLTLFQDADAAAVANTNKEFNPYTSSSVTYFANLLRILESGSSQRIKGAIAKSITISGNEGEALTMSVEWLGADMDGDASNSVVVWSTGHSLSFARFRDMGCSYVTSGSSTGSTGSTVDIIGFDLTITNNAIARHYNNATVQKYILGDLEVTGTLRFPWGAATVGSTTFFDHLNNGENFILRFYRNGQTLSESATGDTAGDFLIRVNAEADDVKTNSDDELNNEVSFTGIYDGRNDIIKVIFWDNIDRSPLA